MISGIFHALVYDPLYNALVFLISVLPSADVGIAVIALTILVKFALFPLAKQAIRTQEVSKRMAPELEEIKKKHKDNREEQVKAMLELYKKYDIHPLSSILLILIQLPIIIGLYWVFWRGGLPDVDASLLYAFTPRPENINMLFLGLVPMAGKSVVLALLAGFSQFIHARFFMQPPPSSGSGSLRDDVMRSLHLQMRYGLPVIVAIFAYSTSSAVALYWLTGNIFTILQEMVVRRSLKAAEAEKPAAQQ